MPVLAGNATEFVQHDRVPAYPRAFCYVFTVPAGRHVSMKLTPPFVGVHIGLAVREVGEKEYRDLAHGMTTFTNLNPEGRFVSTNTDTSAKDFQVYVEPKTLDPHPTQEFTFQMEVR